MEEKKFMPSDSSKIYEILVVDDVPSNIQVLGYILNNKGIDVIFATSGSEALQIIERKRPDLILLDIAMPELDGFEVCKILKNKPETKEIPIIFVTAFVETTDILKGFELGAVDYITKPFNPQVLISRVYNHLKLKKSSDIIKMQNELLDNQNKQLIELNATKDKFFSIVAHDLKAPFSTILGFSRLLTTNIQKQDIGLIEKYAQMIFDAATNTYSLLDNLLEWSRAQTNRTSFEPKQMDLFTVVKNCMRHLSANADKKMIKLVSEVKQNTIVYADENLITSTIRNLLSNALKFTTGGGNIRIKSRCIDNFEEITVSDSGVGIKQEVISKLFRIDVHVSTKGTENESGTGLGLLLCKEFVEKNGGRIWVESQPGLGSDFRFTIPKNSL